MELRKGEQEIIILGDIRNNAIKEFDIIECFDIDDDTDSYDEDSAFNF